MRRELFKYFLPPSQIAFQPAAERRGSRLLTVDGPSGVIAHRHFPDILDLVRPGDLMVFNDTRVIPARLLGHKETGGKLELLVERLVDKHRVLAHIRSGKSPKAGTLLLFDEGISALVTGRRDDLFEVIFAGHAVLEVLERIGHILTGPMPQRTANVIRLYTLASLVLSLRPLLDCTLTRKCWPSCKLRV